LRRFMTDAFWLSPRLNALRIASVSFYSVGISSCGEPGAAKWADRAGGTPQADDR
jgi:hypothetical protein